jgi:TolB-like protein
LGDGLTDELITDLTKVRSIRIIARNTSMKLKHTEKTIASLGRELDVGYVLEGSVRRTGEDVRITTQLVDTADESPIWAERYTGTMEHVFDLQEKVSRAIVDALNVELSREERDALSARPFPNPLAYEYYLKARRDIYEFDGAALERALQNLREGEAIHGSTVPILRGLGLVHMQMLNAGVTEDESLIDEVERYAARIRDIAPSSADAFVLAGCAQVLRGDFQKGVMLLAQAHSRDRHDPDTMLWLGVSMLSTGQPDRSRLIIDELVRIDPLAPLSHLLVGYTAFFQGRFDDSVAPLRRSLDLGPDVQVSLWCAVRLFAAAGLPHEAHAAAQHLQAQHAGTPFAESAGIFAAAVNGHTDDIGEPSEKLRAWAVRDAEWGQYLADAYALAGRDRDALDWLHTSVNAGFLNDTYLAEHDPFVSGLRDSQEFTALLERCVVCHTPHAALLTLLDSPLWNHDVTGASFDLYSSTTLVEQPEQPGGPSKMCLSCHDGTVAIDQFGGGIGSQFINGSSLIGTDLSGCHPVSIQWQHQNDMPSCNNCHDMHSTPTFVSPLPFFDRYVECPTCHHVHNGAEFEHLLRTTLSGSQICLHCHGK